MAPHLPQVGAKPWVSKRLLLPGVHKLYLGGGGDHQPTGAEGVNTRQVSRVRLSLTGEFSHCTPSRCPGENHRGGSYLTAARA